jgi:RNA polymerase subunit RPABC4/transcription elongation factor Spt4
MTETTEPQRNPYGWMLEPLNRLYQQGRITEEKYNHMKQIFRFETQTPVPERTIAEEPLFCRHCGVKLEASTPFCPECGKRLIESPPSSKFCVSCGTKIPANSKYCSQCASKQE